MRHIQGNGSMWKRAFVPTDRGTFEVFLRGEGEPLCVTHLYSEFNETGDRFANVFVPHRKTFLVNLREAGQSPKARDPVELDMEETVEDLEAIRKSLGFYQWDFAGHSTGGMLGLMYAVQHPESLSSLIVVGAAASKDYADQPDCIYHPEHPMFERMQELRGLQLQPDLSPEGKLAYGQETTKLSLFKQENYALYFGGTIRKGVAPVRLNHFSGHDFPRFDLTKNLVNVSTRTLAMCGLHDVQCPIRCSYKIYELMPNSELAVFEESNHYPFLEESDRFAESVASFLKPESVTVDKEFHELCDTCRELFGFHILESEPIVRGWLNRKWKLTTTEGIFLLKSYHPDRYRMYDESALVRALRWQSEIHKQGLPCPELLTYQDAQLHTTSSGQKFVLMTFCNGERMRPGNATVGEMYTLGVATGLMHRLLLTNGGVPTTATFSIPNIPERTEHWTSVLKAIEQNGKHEVYAFAERQLSATKIADISGFRDAEIGWAHRDLWADNILVSDNRLSAILDFDRVNADYLELDVARVIMSGTLDSEELN